jgi:hypothetical protein
MQEKEKRQPFGSSGSHETGEPKSDVFIRTSAVRDE